MDLMEWKPEKLKLVKSASTVIMQQSVLQGKLDNNSNVVYEHCTNDTIICKLFKTNKPQTKKKTLLKPYKVSHE